MSDYWAGLTNCLVVGEELTKTETNSVRNLIRLNLGGFDIELHQHPDVIGNRQNYVGTQVQSTSVWIRDLKKEDFERAENIVRDISEILSFACASQIRKYGYEYSGVTPSSRYHLMIPGVARFFRPVIWSEMGDIVRDFIEKIWPKYHTFRDERQLHIVIDYLAVTQMGGIPQELQLLMSFTALENLKSTYAQVTGIPFRKGAFRMYPTPIKSSPPQDPKYTFKDLLVEMLGKVAMTPSLEEIMKLRNEIIHSGISRMNFSDQAIILDSSQDIIREYLLRLLGFTGRYRLFSRPAKLSDQYPELV